MARRILPSPRCPTTANGCCSAKLAMPAAATAPFTSAAATGRRRSGLAPERRRPSHLMASRCLPRHIRVRSCTCCPSVLARGGRCPVSLFDTTARPGFPTAASLSWRWNRAMTRASTCRALTGRLTRSRPKACSRGSPFLRNGERVIAVLDRKLMIVSTSGGAPQMVPTIPGSEWPIRGLDSDSVLVASRKGYS